MTGDEPVDGLEAATGGRARASRWWPAWALAAVLLFMSRGFVSTPELNAAAKKEPTAAAVAGLADEKVGAIIGAGLSFLGLACMLVFLASLARTAWRPNLASLAPILILLGGTVAAAGMMIVFAMLGGLGGALWEDYAVSTVAAIDGLLSSMGYSSWIALGLTTAGVALGGLRDGTLPRWLGWVSAIFTLVFGALAFFPVVSWALAFLWLLIAGVGLLASRSRERRISVR